VLIAILNVIMRQTNKHQMCEDTIFSITHYYGIVLYIKYAINISPFWLKLLSKKSCSFHETGLSVTVSINLRVELVHQTGLGVGGAGSAVVVSVTVAS
jgi:hypothetical protein